MIIYFFGLPACGKSFLGRILAESETDAVFIEGDDLLPAELQKAVEEGRPFTQDMRDSYYSVIADAILRAIKSTQNVVVSQATIKLQNRTQLRRLLLGHNLRMVWVKCPEELTLQRLRQRGDWVTTDYYRKLKGTFDEGHDADYVLLNDGTNDPLTLVTTMMQTLKNSKQKASCL
eukprot:gnl/MRDRNA2_/MRDRNA2_227445_c0_seq1.p1 gnl/MRDRNA2_/MRDRNA2_227445_c0~~gnl/MRDRNA2_/MRDRNA2_227445_c0_seq1.p1  ORF type:complete len:175 (+),score=28.39 gnl/MRDRNA2_/MRDRNA2_227445_c0_seq1:96-620(+)